MLYPVWLQSRSVWMSLKNLLILDQTILEIFEPLTLTISGGRRSTPVAGRRMSSHRPKAERHTSYAFLFCNAWFATYRDGTQWRYLIITCNTFRRPMFNLNLIQIRCRKKHVQWPESLCTIIKTVVFSDRNWLTKSCEPISGQSR